MKKQFNRFFSLLLALAMVFSLAACGSNGNNTSASGAGGQTSGNSDGNATSSNGDASAEGIDSDSGDTLVIAQEEEATSLLMCYSACSFSSMEIMCAMGTSLFKIGPDGELTGDLVEEYEQVDDYHYRLHLRENVIASDGTPITANDVLWTFQVGAESDNGASWTTYVNVDNCVVEDDYTFLLEAAANIPTEDLWHRMRDLPVYSESCVEALGGLEAASLNPLCTAGMYDFVEWVPGQYILLERNEDYYDQENMGAYKYLKFIFISDTSSRVMSVQSGDADIAMELSYNDVVSCEGNDSLSVIALESARAVGLTFNCADGELFDNQDLRTAIYYACDAAGCAQILYGGAASTIECFTPSVSNWYSGSYDENRAVNLELAKEYLTKAGYPDGLTFTINVEPTAGLDLVGEYVQANLAEIGITVELVTLDLASHFDVVFSGDYDCYLACAGRQAFVTQGAQIYDGRAGYATCGGGVQANNQEVYDLCDVIYNSFDDAERQEAIDALNRLVFDEHYTVGFCNGCYIGLSSSEVTGLVTTEDGMAIVNYLRPVG